MLTNCSPKEEKSFHVLDGKVEIYPIIVPLSVSWDCHNKVPQTGRPRPTQTGCFTDPEAISLKSRCWQSYVLSDSSRREFFLASSSCWCLLAILGSLWLLAASLLLYGCLLHVCFHIIFPLCVSGLCVQISLFIHWIRTLPNDLILT